MRTHAGTRRPQGDGWRNEGPARAPATPGSPDPVTVRPRLDTAADVSALQGAAGNRATAQAIADRRGLQRRAMPGIAVQREMAGAQVHALAHRLHEAMEGWGTDEEAVYGALSGRTPEDISLIRDAYLLDFGHGLQGDIDEEFSGSELARVNGLLQGIAAPSAEAGAAEQGAAATQRAREAARHLREAMEGWGTEEDEIFNVLEGRDQEEILAIEREYLALGGSHLDRDLADELSGNDLRHAMELLGMEAGTFSNEVEQRMTEGQTTVVQGRFEWTLQQRQLTIRVPVEFQPDAGVAVPLADWHSQIQATWGGFAAVETGGITVPIQFQLENRHGAEKQIRVKQNRIPGQRSVEDRANAGMWFPIMKPTTAPHEFGHLVGLQDEYQRTHGDYRRIVGSEPAAGPANASGRTAAAIATDLHAALHLEDAAQRAPRATTLLEGAGLIVSGIPQQGGVAQEVLTAYDAAHGSLVDDLRDKLPEGSKWTIQSVFSFASRSIMGDPDVLGGRTEHDHPVEPRHLAEFVAIVRRSYPGLTWEAGRA